MLRRLLASAALALFIAGHVVPLECLLSCAPAQTMPSADACHRSNPDGDRLSEGEPCVERALQTAMVPTRDAHPGPPPAAVLNTAFSTTRRGVVGTTVAPLFGPPPDPPLANSSTQLRI